MSANGTVTTADYLNFDKTLNLAMKMLKNDSQYKIGFLIVLGINSGLRISDLLGLTYTDLNGEYIELKEKKTNKHRQIKINDYIKQAIKLLKNRSGIETGHIFTSNQNTIISIQYVNRKLKEVLKEKGKNISSHTLRKTFGRRVWQNNNESDKALIFLSDIFNHTNAAITRRYLGIRQEEISEIYMNL